MKPQFTFSKAERLCSQKSIETLFANGEKWACYPFRLVLRMLDHESENSMPEACVQILISVSKRNFKRAVDRNKIKRRIREAYRTQKQLLMKLISDRLSESAFIQIHIGFLYTAKTIEPWQVFEKKMARALEEIGNQLLKYGLKTNEK